MGAGANIERAIVWSDGERPGDVCRDAGDSHGGGSYCGIFAGAAGFADRSDGGVADELKEDLRQKCSVLRSSSRRTKPRLTRDIACNIIGMWQSRTCLIRA